MRPGDLLPFWEHAICLFVHIIARATLQAFWMKHPDAEVPLRAWHAVVEGQQWGGPADIKRTFPHASFLANNRVVFNVGGNNYRVVVKVIYPMGRVYVRFVGSHTAYDKIDANEV